MDTTVHDAKPCTRGPMRAPSPQLQEVWHDARSTDLARTAPLGVLASLVAASLWLLDLESWPPHLRQPVSDQLPWVLVLAVIFFISFVGISWYQKRSSPERYLSPLLGLDGERRSIAKQALDSGVPSDDSFLREVETARAEQIVRTAPETIGSAIVVPAIYVVVTIVLFSLGSTALGVLWAIVTAFTAFTGLRNLRAGGQARAYLTHLRSTTSEN